MKMSWSKRQKFAGYLFIAPNMLGIIIFFLIPALISFVVMFTDLDFLSKAPVNFIGLDNFARVFSDETFYTALKNTFIFLLAVPVSIAIAVFLAILLNNKIYLKPILRAMYFMPYITSSVAIAFVWSLLLQPTSGPINGFLRSVGLADPPRWLASTETSMYGIDLIMVWYTLGFNMIIYLAALQEIPTELLEAAKIDGARAWQTTLRIILPLISPTTFFLLITGLMGAIKTFGLIQAITQGGPGDSTVVLSLFVYRTAFSYYELGYASAIAWVLFVIVLVITAIQWVGQKKWVYSN
ncbi:MAG: sugar ABC transporter permease [Chloroflexi bacterium]|nr:sugar ABC transporter permease [Chloroflexota bacterium]OJV90121.1 MAG: sugar ABC transporter permease [Chloroflexi bacterium 54-19]